MKLIRYVVVPALLTALAGPVLAAGSKYKVTFDANGQAPLGAKVSVVFTAQGCAGSKRCGKKRQFAGSRKQANVCKQTLNLKPGETTSYSFKPLTSGRAVVVCSNAEKSSKFELKNKEVSFKHTRICAKPDGSWHLSGSQFCD